MNATKYIAVTSGKGGVGKSTISANMANVLASEGYSVALFDADIGLANLDVILNVRSEKNLLNVMRGECGIRDVILRVKPNLILIPGDSGDEIIKLTDAFLNERFVKEMSLLDGLDFVIVDTGAGIGDSVQPFLMASDEVIIVTAPDPAAITDAYATLKITNRFKENLYMLFNMVESANEAKEVFENLRKVALNNIQNPLNLHYLGYIKSSPQVARSIKARTLFTDDYPHISPTCELKEAISKLLVNMDKSAIKTASSHGFGGFLRRLSELI